MGHRRYVGRSADCFSASIPRIKFWHPIYELWSIASYTHQCCHICIRWKCSIWGSVLYFAAGIKTRLFNDVLSRIHFWGWQLIIVLGAVSLALGYTAGKEYAELEWPLDILIAIIWVIFGINMIGTILKRRERHLYVSIWFFIGTWVTVAMLHIVNSFELPISLTKSYSLYAGVQDALVQWWYGHNAVAFFLTTPFLGLMYYIVPKAANRPIYSYRWSIIHFLGFDFYLYMGWSSSSIIHCASRMGPGVGYGV